MRSAVFDLETSNLKANFAVLLCAAVKPIGGKPKTIFAGRYGVHDRELCLKVRDELEKYNILIGFNTLWFDVPFLNSRLWHWNERPLKPMLHIDVYRVVRRRFATHRKNLDTLTNFTGIRGKSHVDFEDWLLAALEGNKNALRKIVRHCEKDVRILERFFMERRICDQVRSISLS